MPAATSNLVEYTFENGGSQKARWSRLCSAIPNRNAWRHVYFVDASELPGLLQFCRFPGATEKELRGGAPFGSDEAYLKWRGNSRLDWIWHHFDLGTTVHYLAGFHEVINTTAQSGILFPTARRSIGRSRPGSSMSALRYDLTFAAPVELHPVAGYSKGEGSLGRSADGSPNDAASAQSTGGPLSIWKRALNGVKRIARLQQRLGQDPPRLRGELGSKLSRLPLRFHGPLCLRQRQKKVLSFWGAMEAGDLTFDTGAFPHLLDSLRGDRRFLRGNGRGSQTEAIDDRPTGALSAPVIVVESADALLAMPPSRSLRPHEDDDENGSPGDCRAGQ